MSMEEHTDQVAAIESLGSELQSNFDRLREQQQARLQELSSLMASLESVTRAATSETEALQSMAEGALGQIDACKAEMGATGGKSQEFQGRIAELESALENADREKAALADKVQSSEAHQEKLNEARSELTARNEAFENLQREYEELRRVHDQSHGELESLRSRAREAEEKLAALEEEAASRAGEGQSLEDRIAALEAEIEAKDQALQNAQAALESAQDDQHRVGAEFEALSAAQQQAEAAQESLKTELLAVQREMEALRSKYKEGLSTEAALALRQQVTETAAQVKRLESELEAARGKSKKSYLAQQLADAVEEAEQANEENKALKQEIALLREGIVPAAQELAPAAAPAANAAPPFEGLVQRSPEADLLRIQEAARNLAHGPKRVIGQILLDADIITDDQLQQALELQKSNPQQHLGSLLAELGFASEEAVAQARASQCGVEFIRFDEHTVNPEAASLISERLANQHSCIPIAVSDRGMVLAVTNPMDLLAIEDVERFTNKKVEVVVGTAPEIENAISRYYWEPE